MDYPYRTKTHARNLDGARIATDHGPAIVLKTYPDSHAGQWDAWLAVVMPEGYAAPRTIALPFGYADVLED